MTSPQHQPSTDWANPPPEPTHTLDGNELSYAFPESSPLTHANLTSCTIAQPTVHTLRTWVEGELMAVQRLVANEVTHCTDQIAYVEKQIDGDSRRVARSINPGSLLNELLAEMRELSEYASDVDTAVQYLAVFLPEQGNDLPITSSKSDVRNSADHSLEQFQSLIQFGTSTNPEVDGAIVTALTSFELFWNKAEAVLVRSQQTSHALGRAVPPDSGTNKETVREDMQAVDVALLQELCRLTEQVRSEPGDPLIQKRGAVIGAPTVERYQSWADSGGQLITYREDGAIRGYTWYFDRVPEWADLPKQGYALRDDPLAYLGMVFRDPSLENSTAARALMNSTLVHLQSTGARTLCGHLQEENIPAAALYHSYGGALNPADIHSSMSQQGRPTSFLGFKIPVDPRVRARTSAAIQPADSGLIEGLREQQLPGIFVEKSLTEALAHHYAGLSFEESVDHLSMTTGKTALIITGGCADMSLLNWEGAPEYFKEVLKGYDGALMSGGTQMKFSLNGEATEHVVPGITDLIPTVSAELGSGARTMGVISVDTEWSQTFNPDKATTFVRADDGTIAEGVSSFKSHITTVHSGFEHRRFVDVARQPPGITVWQGEAAERMAISQALAERGITPIWLVFNGGETTAWEMEETPFPVVVLNGSGRIADDKAFHATLGEKLISVNYDPKDPRALRETLLSLGCDFPSHKIEGRLVGAAG